jgi:hypothetical protein
MSAKINWTQDWPPQDYTGFTPKQIRNAKHMYGKLGKLLIDAQIKKLGKKIKYRVSWKRNRTAPVYQFYTYLTPPAVLIPKNRNAPPGGGTGSNVSPTPPPKP